VSTCGSDRGGTFTESQSSTWEDKGLYQLPLDPEHYLPFSGAAKFGFDNVTLDWQGFNGTTLERQVVAGYITEDIYLGALGLSPLSVNITSFDDRYPSFLGSLRARNDILSNSYGYTAGASYHSYPISAFASLTLGGYESSRMDKSRNLTIVGGSDTYRPMLVGIEDIQSGPTQLLDGPVIAALDSIVSQIWLPISACRRFESTFGLVWNPKYELYIVNETQHSMLLTQNASITFTLSTGSEQNRDDRLDITLPYAAFDLIAKPPFAGLNESVHYFPLKQAANDTQYTLGRTFLQETYMIADYDRAALSLFPAVFPDSSIDLGLVPIISPWDMPEVQVTEDIRQGRLSRAAIIGIAVGSTVFLVLVTAGVLFLICRGGLEKARKAVNEITSTWEKPELAGDRAYYRSELEGHDDSGARHELDFSARVKPELPCPVHIRELNGSHIMRNFPPQEMSDDHSGAESCPHDRVNELA
jgi:hypothetical protein